MNLTHALFADQSADRDRLCFDPAAMSPASAFVAHLPQPYPVGGTVCEALQAIATRRGTRLDVRALINREFEQYDQAYVVHKALRKQRLDALKRRLASRERSGKLLACSRGMISEAESLLNYTAELPRLD